MSKIVVTGATGMIGTSLIRTLTHDQMHIVQLLRKLPPKTPQWNASVDSVLWEPGKTRPIADPGSLEGTDAVVHLAGAPVAGKRWTESYKKEIVSSRVQTTLSLVKMIAHLNPRPRVLVCASAIGIYGDRGQEILTEKSSPGTGFLAETCVAWEQATRAAEDAGIRVVHARFGVVMSLEGGALPKLLPLFRLGLGGKLGSGREWMPWLTLRDAVGMLRYCLENDRMEGPVNAVARQAVTNAEFTAALGAALRRPAVIPVPAFALRLAFGEMANEALLASARVVPETLVRSGYKFIDPDIGPALRELVAG